jgi:hypothetical protein
VQEEQRLARPLVDVVDSGSGRVDEPVVRAGRADVRPSPSRRRRDGSPARPFPTRAPSNVARAWAGCGSRHQGASARAIPRCLCLAHDSAPDAIAPARRASAEARRDRPLLADGSVPEESVQQRGSGPPLRRPGS